MEKGSIRNTWEGFISSSEYENIKCGSSKSKGNVKSNEVKVLGDAKFEGDINIKICY